METPTINKTKGNGNGRWHSTLEMSREEWLASRKQYIGGSDVSAILGLNPYKNRMDLYFEKVNELAVEEPDNDRLWFGREVEPVIAKRFAEEYGLTVKIDNKIRTNREHPFLAANIDRLIESVDERGPGILEIKTTNKFYAETWENEIPEMWLTQLYHYMSVTGYRWAYIAYLVDRDFHVFYVERDEEVDQVIKRIEEKLVSFWKDHVEPQMPPPPQNYDEVVQLFPTEEPGKSVELSKNMRQMFLNYLAAKDDEKKAKAEAEEIRDAMAVYMEDAEVLAFGEKPVATFKHQSQTRIDSKRLKSEQPDIAEQYSKTTESRVFRPNKNAEEILS